MLVAEVFEKKMAEVIKARQKYDEVKYAKQLQVNLENIQKVLDGILDIFQNKENDEFINFVRIDYDGVGTCHFRISVDGLFYRGHNELPSHLNELVSSLDEIRLNGKERIWIAELMERYCQVVDGGYYYIFFMRHY